MRVTGFAVFTVHLCHSKPQIQLEHYLYNSNGKLINPTACALIQYACVTNFVSITYYLNGKNANIMGFFIVFRKRKLAGSINVINFKQGITAAHSIDISNIDFI